MPRMTNEEAISILKHMQEPEPCEPQITFDEFDAIELAIEALEKQIESMGGNSGIIHCKDCKKFVYDNFNIPYCYKDPGHKWNENDYCSKAERRNDG